MSITQEFRDLQSDVQQDISDAQMYDDWVPPATPAGTLYNCLLAEVAAGVSEKDNQQSLWVALRWRIMDGELAGKTFTTFFTTKAVWAMGQLFELAALLTQDPSHTENRILLDAAESLESYGGKAIVEVCVRLKKDREGNDRPKYSFNRVLDMVAEATG